MKQVSAQPGQPIEPPQGKIPVRLLDLNVVPEEDENCTLLLELQDSTGFSQTAVHCPVHPCTPFVPTLMSHARELVCSPPQASPLLVCSPPQLNDHLGPITTLTVSQGTKVSPVLDRPALDTTLSLNCAIPSLSTPPPSPLHCPPLAGSHPSLARPPLRPALTS